MDLIRSALFVLFIAGVGLLTFLLGLFMWGAWNDEWTGYNSSLQFSDGSCNVAILSLYGEIYPGYSGIGGTGADDFVSQLRIAEADDGLIGVLVRIDSPGGTPVASEVLAQALQESPLPTVALIRDMGASGAYMAATGADYIVASEFSDVGGIGVSMSYLEYVRQNDDLGLDFVSLASAPYKDYGNPYAPLTDEARALLERDLKMYHDVFVRLVAQNRNLPLETVQRLADGATVPGALALEAGLIDALGDQSDTRSVFATLAEVDPEDVVFCE